MIEHKLILLDKKSGDLETIIFKNTNNLLDILPMLYKENNFFIEIEIDVDNITLEEYKKIILTNPESEGFKFPENIKNIEDLKEWIDAWKVLEDVFELSALS